MIHNAVILSTGDELTTGKVVDTNSAVIAEQLFTLGIRVAAVLKVGDDADQLLWAFARARELADLVIGSGGLGPTADDLTTEMVARFIGRKLIRDDQIAENIRKRFELRGIPWTDNNLKQALFPEGAMVVPNPVGTAPGFHVTLGENKHLFWLSGVPGEMKAMLEATVIPWVGRQRGQESNVYSCTFKIYGVTESKLDNLVEPIALPPQAKLSFRAHFPDLTLRLTVSGGKEQEAAFVDLTRQIRRVLGSHIYAEGDITMEARVGQLLLQRKQTLALAESCTGGLISQRITRVAGSSAYYYGGAVTYANEAKMNFLGVTPATLEKYGAVSEPTALEMSRGIRERTGANIGLSVSGIAGPTGGSAEKPVGTVWMSIAREGAHEARHFQFHGDRERIILGASQAALNWLRMTLSS
ncbi:MAG TPA: competence/damage-inducible protein A [Candidatus Binatia bacterium]|jgi:nicotinamide-nucleotide amidase